MATKYNGWMFYELGGMEHEVVSVHLANDRVRVGWLEDGDDGTLDVTSSDGVTYEGGYSYKTGYPGKMTLRLYAAKDGAVILIGNWVEDGTGERGRWLFHLKALSAVRKARP